MSTNPDKHWNLFAWELENILAAHGSRLNTLKHPGLPQDKLQRLQESLYISPAVPVLNPAEIQLLDQMLFLDYEEEARLQAALLTAAIQRLLIEYIERDQTFQVASQAFELIRANLWEQLERKKAEGEKRGDSDAEENRGRDTTWAFVYHELDAGDLALQLSQHAATKKAQINKAREAHAAFESALFELNSLDGATKAMNIWRKRYNEARLGLEAALHRLQNLGTK